MTWKTIHIMYAFLMKLCPLLGKIAEFFIKITEPNYILVYKVWIFGIGILNPELAFKSTYGAQHI